MLEDLSDEEVVCHSPFDLLQMAFSEPVPHFFTELPDPPPSDPFFPPINLTEAEIHLVELLGSVLRRLQKIELAMQRKYERYVEQHGETSEEEAVKIFTEVELDVFERMGILFDFFQTNLQAGLDYRIKYDRSMYRHLIAASDGYIYGCVGNCLECITAISTDEKKTQADSLDHAH